MLLNSQGKPVQIPHISVKDPNRESILAALREVHENTTLSCRRFFSLQARAKLKS